MNNQKYNYVPAQKGQDDVAKSMEQQSIELTRVLINEYKHYGFSYVFKKFMNPYRTYKEIDQFLMECFYGTRNPHEQNPTTYIVTGIDQIDFVAFAAQMNKEATDRGFQLNVEEGMIVQSKEDNSYKPQYIIYHLTNGYRLIITAAGFDFDIEKYINDEAGK